MGTQKENTQKSFLERYFDFMDRIEGRNKTLPEQIYRRRILGEPTNKQKAEKLKYDFKLSLKDVATFDDLKSLWHVVFTPDSILYKELEDDLNKTAKGDTINYLKFFKL